VPPGIKAVLLRMFGNDGGSAANEVWFGVRPVGAATWALVCRPSGKTNDMMAEAYGWVPCDDNGDIEYEIDASGAGEFDAYLAVWGFVLPG